MLEKHTHRVGEFNVVPGCLALIAIRAKTLKVVRAIAASVHKGHDMINVVRARILRGHARQVVLHKTRTLFHEIGGSKYTQFTRVNRLEVAL